MHKSWYGLMVLILSVQLSFAQGEAVQENRSVPVFKFQANERLEVNVNLEYDKAGNPTFYKSHLDTEVCSDSLCKPVSITIRWDLLGNFNSYYTGEAHELTKFDHVKLTKEDHKKLHEILSDTASILRDYEVEDMIDTSVHVKSLKLDAVTGATSQTFDGATVEGALYTVYTLWHFINGDIRRKLREHTESLLSDVFVKQMLHSDKRDYLSFVFAHITDRQRKKFLPDIVGLVANKDDYIPHFALAQLTDEALSDYSRQHALLEALPTAALALQNILLERLGHLKLDEKGLTLLLNSIPGLTEGQSAKALSIIKSNRSQLNKKF